MKEMTSVTLLGLKDDEEARIIVETETPLKDGLFIDCSKNLRCRYCLEQKIQETEIDKHVNSTRHKRLLEQFVSQGNSAYGPIITVDDDEGDKNKWVCAVCQSCSLQSWDRVKSHLLGKTHRINLRRKLTNWYSTATTHDGTTTTTTRLDPPYGLTLHCVGDSHGGKYLFQSMSPKVKCHFITGSMHSFASGKRPVNLKKLGVKPTQLVLFGYGEIDARCHIGRIAKERGCSDFSILVNPLVESYIDTITRRVTEINNCEGGGGGGGDDDALITAVLVLAVPPPSDRRENPQAPFHGTLSERIQITKRMNRILKERCNSNKIHFFDPFDGFASPDGSLNHEFSDGHVHIRSDCSRVVHERLVRYLEKVLKR